MGINRCTDELLPSQVHGKMKHERENNQQEAGGKSLVVKNKGKKLHNEK